MYKGYKKTIAILVTCALIGALFCLPVSAESYSINSGGAVITAVSSQYISADGSSSYNNTINFYDNNRFSVHNLEDTFVIGNRYAASTIFNFSASNNYGVLEVNVLTTFGTAYSSSYNRIYDDITGTNLGAECVLNNGVYTFTYEGYIPSRIRIATYAISESDVMVTYYYDFSFTPIDKATQDIIDNQNQNAQDIQDNQDKNTQSIIDNQNDLAEQEKQEISDSGNQATDAADSIPNESEGFINALTTFVSTMSTTDTACSITFPSLKVPSIAGIPEATLSEEKEVNFEDAISLMPENILKLVQALTTIALIVYCFKELYDTISEALTRKRANSDG